MESIIRGKQTNRRKKIEIHVRSVSFGRATRQQVRAHRRVAARHILTPGGGVLKQTESNVTAFHHHDGTPRRSRPGL